MQVSYLFICDLLLVSMLVYMVYNCYITFKQDIEYITTKINIIEVHLSQMLNTEIKMKNDICALSENCIHLPRNFASLPFYTKRRILLTFPALDGLYIRPHLDSNDNRYRIPTTRSM
jgi:hypothetical protein